MNVSPHVYELATSFGKENGLTDSEIARLAGHIQYEVESEIDYLLTVRKESHVD